MLNIRSLFLLSLCLTFFRIPTAIAQDSIPYLNVHIQNGDLLFVGAQEESLSGAINRVTQQHSNISYDHVGILEVCKDQVYILHAVGKKGSVREPLDSLISSKEESKQQFALYRLSGTDQSVIHEAIDMAKTLLGQPYNWSYVLNDTSLYCSDFVERAFRHADIFELEPMTFINPATKKTDSFWLNFYKKLQMEVPEGELGCNPNGLAANEHLIQIGYLEPVTK